MAMTAARKQVTPPVRRHPGRPVKATKQVRQAPVTPKVPPKKLSAIEEKLVLLADTRSQAKELGETATQLQAELIQLMDESEVTNVKAVTESGETITAKIVEASRDVIDEGKLKKLLGAVMWKKITTAVLDRNKLDAFIKSGEINPQDVAKASNTVTNNPYLRVDRK